MNSSNVSLEKSWKKMAARIPEAFVSSLAKIRSPPKIGVSNVSPKEKLRETFETLDIYLRIFSHYRGSYDRKQRGKLATIGILLSSINCHVLLVCFWINQLRLIPILVKEGEYSPVMMVTLLLFFAYMSTSCGFTSWFVMMHRHYDTIKQSLESIVTVSCVPYMLNHFVLCVNVIILTGLVFLLYSLVPLFKDPDSLMTEIRLTPAVQGTYFWEFMKYFYAYYGLHAYGQFILFTIFQGVVCYFLQREFKDVAERMEMLAQKQDESWEEGQLEKLRLRHKDICLATMAADRIASFIVFTVYVTGILIACFCVSCLTHSSYPKTELPTLFAVSFACIGQVFFLSIVGAILNHQAHRPYDILTRIKTPTLNRNDYRSLLVFLAQVSGSNIGITALRMFTVNKPAILTILGTIITYAVIIQQLRVSPNKEMHHLANVTNHAHM